MYNLGQYLDRESPVHKRDPRAKIIAVLALSMLILNLEYKGLIMAFGFIILVSWVAKISPGALVQSTRPVLPFFLVLFLIYLLFTPGQPILPFPTGPIKVSYQGLYLGMLQVAKFMLLVWAASILTFTTSMSELTMGLERMLRPLKVVGISSHNVATMIALALRFIPTLLDEMNSIKEAQLARGANFNPGGLSGKISSLYYLAAPLSLRILDHSDRLVEAMEARGYQSGPRTYICDLILTPMDYLIISGFIAVTIAVWIL